MRKILTTLLTVTAIAAVLVIATPGQADISEKDAAKIREAAPEKTPAKPEKPRKLLVYSRCTGYRHGSIPYIIEAVKVMGQKTGAYEAVVTDDMSMFAPDKLEQFDAVFLNNTTGELFRPSKRLPDDQQTIATERGDQLRESLLQFVKSGKGLAGVHAATDCSYKWPAYGEMIGGYFDGHPWNQKVAVKLDEPSHPLNAAFEGDRFEVHDEIYQFKAPYSRSKQRVLLSLDMEGTPDKGKRKDDDYAVSWVKPYGKGRVFYCSLGHRKQVVQTPELLAHYLAGIQYALGDLEATDTPSKPATDEDGFVSLFNGEDLTGWTQRKSPDDGGWYVDEDGVIAWRKGAGFLWSDEEYQDFVLKLQFKVSEGANSGVFFRTKSKKNWLHTGIEMQVLDSHGKADPGKHDCGAIYDVLAPAVNAAKPAGEWNDLTITAKGDVIQIVMNAQKIIDMDLSNWTKAHRNPDGSKNKFNYPYEKLTWPGYLAFQDHGRPVWYRHIRIKPLD